MFFSPKNKNAIVLIALSMVAIFLSGLFFSISYFFMDTIQTNLESVDCTLPSATGYSTCQEWFEDTIYNLLNLKELIIYFSYIFIFILVLGMLICGYNVGGKPIYMGIYLLVVLLLTYGSLLLSNVYRSFLLNETIYDMLLPFTIYNKIMLNFPWFIGFVGLLSVGLSIVNYQRAKVNEPEPANMLDY